MLLTQPEVIRTTDMSHPCLHQHGAEETILTGGIIREQPVKDIHHNLLIGLNQPILQETILSIETTTGHNQSHHLFLAHHRLLTLETILEKEDDPPERDPSLQIGDLIDPLLEIETQDVILDPGRNPSQIVILASITNPAHPNCKDQDQILITGSDLEVNQLILLKVFISKCMGLQDNY